MPGSVFKIVVDGGDWGIPMANEATFDNLEEAQAEARSYLERQRAAGGPGALLRGTIEELAADGSVVKHVITQANPAFACTPNETAAESPPSNPCAIHFHDSSEAAALLDAQLRQLNRAVLRGGGTVSKTDADRHVDTEYRKFDERRRALRAERTRQELASLKAADKNLPKGRPGPSPKKSG
jgi:hypothetical protein